MNKTELRIGNMIRDIESGRIGTVLTLGTKKCTAKMEFSKLMQDYDEFEPIPLSEEWLLKMGFQKLPALDKWYITNPPKYYYENYFFIIKDGGKWWLTKSKSADGSNDLRINSVGFDSVHQLQNLTHSLTGEELTIKN